MARVYLADKDTLDTVNTKVGTANDAASATPTSLFAGIKQLISVLSGHIASWTSARANKIDNLDASISSRAAASTALNKNTWTDTRAGYLDRLVNGTYGLEAIKNEINSVTGAIDKYYVPSNTIIQNLGFSAVAASVTNTEQVSSWKDNFVKASDNFTPKADGIVYISGTATKTCNMYSDASVSIISLGSSGLAGSRYNMNDALTASVKTRGTDLKTLPSTNGAADVYQILWKQSSNNETKNFTIPMKVQKGFPVFVILQASAGAVGTVSLTLSALQVKGTLNTI